MGVLLRYSIGGRSASQVAASVEAGVRRGSIPAGAPLPTVRALAADLGLSPATVAAAYRTLRSRGLLASHGRRGTHVTPRPPVASPSSPVSVPAHLRNLAEGSPDPALLPPLRPVLSRLGGPPRLYGAELNHRDLLRRGARQLAGDGIPVGQLAVVGGALDGIERVLTAQLRPGDRVAIEDPGYTGVLDLLTALGLVAEPIVLDDSGPLAGDLDRALRSRVQALIVTPRAQNPTGAALDERRARQLRRLLDGHPDLLLIEDDHAGPVAGAPAVTLVRPDRPRWAVVRSVAKSLGPDLRLAILAGDATTVARVEGRQRLGIGWVSHVLQRTVAALWADPRTTARLRAAAGRYAERRQALIDALARRGVAAHGRSGLNVWVPVPDEQRTLAMLAEAGWAVRGAERYRIRSGPAVRITTAALEPNEAERLAADLVATLRPESRTHSA